MVAELDKGVQPSAPLRNVENIWSNSYEQHCICNGSSRSFETILNVLIR